MNSINHLGWESRIEFEIALIDRDALNFDKSFLYFNVKKERYSKFTLILTRNIEY